MSAKVGRRAAGQSENRTKAERPKGGRPRRDPGAVAKPLAIRLTPSERRVIEGAAERDGMSVSDWARRAMLLAAQGV